jgi:hypothetical protein
LLTLLLLLVVEAPLPPISCVPDAFVESILPLLLLLLMSSCESTCPLDKFSLCDTVVDTYNADELVVAAVVVDLE